MVWFGSTVFASNKESLILSKCFIKSLLLVITVEEKSAYKKWFQVTQRQLQTNPNLLH